jgi:hypothetical protein
LTNYAANGGISNQAERLETAVVFKTITERIQIKAQVSVTAGKNRYSVNNGVFLKLTQEMH